MKRKLKDAQTDRGLRPATPVDQLDYKTEILITSHPSQQAAARATGAAQCSISLCCSGKRGSAGGFKWRYSK